MLKSFYLTRNTFIWLGLCVVLFSFGLINNTFFILGKLLFFLLWIAVVIETVLIFQTKKAFDIDRKLPNKLSNGDPNLVIIKIKNHTKYDFQARVIEELPVLLQVRKWEREIVLKKEDKTEIKYFVEPKERGLYEWNDIHLFVQLKAYSLVSRKEKFDLTQEIACYPSFDQFVNLPIKAMVNNLESNEKVVRKIGQSLEFEQIKDYSSGDDYRHINWKASAKRGNLMVNQYQDERSQDIYCAIDLGRTMKMPFNHQTLLDYAINGCLALSKTIIQMNDRAGLLGFSYNKTEFLPAKKDLKQFGKINDMLYNISTAFKESDFETLYKIVRINIKHRSLIVLFTNFDSVNAMHRSLQYLKALNRHHLLLVVFFENSEIADIVDEQALDIKEIYNKTIGHNMLMQNRLIVRELGKHGIKALLSKPEELSLNTINQYLDIKKKRLL